MLLAITNFNVVISVVGGWLVLVGVFSHLLSDAFYLSEAREPSPLLTHFAIGEDKKETKKKRREKEQQIPEIMVSSINPRL